MFRIYLLRPIVMGQTALAQSCYTTFHIRIRLYYFYYLSIHNYHIHTQRMDIWLYRHCDTLDTRMNRVRLMRLVQV